MLEELQGKPRYDDYYFFFFSPHILLNYTSLITRETLQRDENRIYLYHRCTTKETSSGQLFSHLN